MVREANPINEVWEDFTAFVGNAILVAHQASLDMNILRKSAEHYKLAPLTNPVLDTLRLAKRLYPEEVSYGLSHFQALLGLTAVEHRASADAHVTAFLFKHLVQILEDRHGVSEYQQLWDFCYGEKPLQMKLF
jgi:DNA polymerase-3 subunit alpha (Gram-positive type)